MTGAQESSPVPESKPEAHGEKTSCPFCRASIPAGAMKCAHCGANVGDTKLCPACAEPIRAAAVKCPFCTTDLRPAEPAPAPLLGEPWVVYASNIGSFFTEFIPTSLLFPPVMTVTEREIHIRRKLFIGLRTLDQKIAVSRIASVRALQGMFWGGIVVETYGGAAGVLSINGLSKTDASNTALVIERLTNIHSRSGQS